MAEPEKSTIETTIASCSEGQGRKSGKAYMKVKLGTGQETTNFDTGMFQDFRDAQASGVQVRLTLYRNPKGYSTIDTIDPVPKPSDPPPEHFLGAGGAPKGTPGGSGSPGPQTAPPSSGNSPVAPLNDGMHLCRALCALAAGMVCWGGRFGQSEAELWKIVGRFNRFVETGQVPGFAVNKPVQPDANPGEKLPGYDDDL